VVSTTHVFLSSSRTVGKGVKLLLWDVYSRLGLAEKRNNGLARVSTNDWNDGLLWVSLAGDALDKGLGTDDIESGDTEQLLWVELAGGLQYLGSDWDGAVDWVGDDKEVGVWAVLGDTLDEVANDAGVDLEEIVTGHTWLACGGVSIGTPQDYMRWYERGIPAGITTMSAPVKAFFMPSSAGR